MKRVRALVLGAIVAIGTLVPMRDAAAQLLNLNLLNIVRVKVQVTGNRVAAGIDVPILPLPVDAELILDFQNAQNLNLANLGISARLVNPLDPTFRARLPSGGLLNVPLALPLVIRVEPPPGGGLEFTNTVGVELHTHLLPFAINTPLRLYKAPLGGQFYDITDDIASGSIRTRGRTGDFSEFIVLIDLTPLGEAADRKYEFLEERLAGATISPAARTVLEAELTASRVAFEANDMVEAKAAMGRFIAAVEANAGVGIPNRWRAARDLDNVAGDLIGEASSLRYSLTRLGG